MGNKKKKRNYSDFLNRQKELSPTERERKNAAFKKNKRFIFPLIINTVIFYTVYAIFSNTQFYSVTLWTYFALLLGFSAAYVIYNQGFYRKNITPEQLPSSMTDEEKQVFIDEGKSRMERSKWMITIIFPLVITFLIDMVILFMIEPLIESLGF